MKGIIWFIAAFSTTVGLFALVKRTFDTKTIKSEPSISVDIEGVPLSSATALMTVVNPYDERATLVDFQTPCSCSVPKFTKITLQPRESLIINVVINTLSVFERFPQGTAMQLVPVLLLDSGRREFGVPIAVTFRFLSAYSVCPNALVFRNVSDECEVVIAASDFTQKKLKITECPGFVVAVTKVDEAGSRWIVSLKCFKHPSMQQEAEIKFAIEDKATQILTEGRIPVRFLQPVLPRFESSHITVNRVGRRSVRVVGMEGFHYVETDIPRSDGLIVRGVQFDEASSILSFDYEVQDEDLGICEIRFVVSSQVGDKYSVEGTVIAVSPMLSSSQ